MIEVRGKPVLQHIVEGLRDAGLRDLLIVVGYRAEAVQNFFGDGSRYKIAIQYKTQTVQDGTGRVVELARDFVSISPFVLSYGDILVDPANYKRVVDLSDDFEAMRHSHARRRRQQRRRGVSLTTRWIWSIFAKNQNPANRPAPGITPAFTRFGQAFLSSPQN